MSYQRISSGQRYVSIFRNYASIYGEELLVPRPTYKLEDRPLSAVRCCLFNIFAATLHIEGRSSIYNLRRRLAWWQGPTCPLLTVVISLSICRICFDSTNDPSKGSIHFVHSFISLCKVLPVQSHSTFLEIQNVFPWNNLMVSILLLFRRLRSSLLSEQLITLYYKDIVILHRPHCYQAWIRNIFLSRAHSCLTNTEKL
jgi:hypothetical protein